MMLTILLRQQTKISLHLSIIQANPVRFVTMFLINADIDLIGIHKMPHNKLMIKGMIAV